MLFDGAPDRHAGVVDQNVDVRVLADDFFGKLAHPLLVGDVRLVKGDSAPCGSDVARHFLEPISIHVH